MLSSVTMALCCIICEIRQDINRKSGCFHIPLYSTPPSEYCHPSWCGKTRMVGLPDGEINLKICVTVIDSMPACDRRTDKQTPCHGIVRARHIRRAVKTERQIRTFHDEMHICSVTGGGSLCRSSDPQMIHQVHVLVLECSPVPSAPRPSCRPNC